MAMSRERSPARVSPVKSKANDANTTDINSASSTKKPFVVVLTGGPSSGKSSALALLKTRLSMRGFQVLTVPENATHLLANSDGFQPEWAGTFQQVTMQRIFMDFQLEQEKAFREFAALNQRPAVMLLDRSVLDSKVFMSDEQWEQALAYPGRPAYTESELMGRYDLVIHMVTCAGFGEYEWGPGSNNPGRYHSPEQAIEQDARCLQVYGPHQQLRVVPHHHDFEQKVTRVCEFVNDALHIDGLTGRRVRLEVRMAACPPTDLEAAGYLVTSQFLNSEMTHCVRRRAKIPIRFWMACLADGNADMNPELSEIMYERRHNVRPADPSAKAYLSRKVISEADYYALASSSTAVEKCVLSFTLDRSYYELFFFRHSKNLILDMDETASLPLWLVEQAPQPNSAITRTAGQFLKPDTRVLVRHTTEEAAEYVKRYRSSPSK